VADYCSVCGYWYWWYLKLAKLGSLTCAETIIPCGLREMTTCLKWGEVPFVLLVFSIVLFYWELTSREEADDCFYFIDWPIAVFSILTDRLVGKLCCCGSDCILMTLTSVLSSVDYCWFYIDDAGWGYSEAVGRPPLAPTMLYCAAAGRPLRWPLQLAKLTGVALIPLTARSCHGS